MLAKGKGAVVMVDELSRYNPTWLEAETWQLNAPYALRTLYRIPLPASQAPPGISRDHHGYFDGGSGGRSRLSGSRSGHQQRVSPGPAAALAGFHVAHQPATHCR